MTEPAPPDPLDLPAPPLADPIDAFRKALFARTPRAWVTPAVVALNVAVFLAMVATGVSALHPSSASLLAWGADYGPRTTHGQPWRLLTNTFIHVGVFHIVMNMIGLWQVGRMVERLLGNLGFIVTYVMSGLCGSLVSTWWHPFTVSAGASGAIFGVYGALIAYLLRHRGQIPRAILASLQRTAVAFVALNVVFGMQQKGIDMAAHLGGLGGGLLAGLFVGRPVGESARAARRRALIVAAAGAALIALATARLPPSADLADEITVFQAVEKNAIAAYNDGVERIARDQLKDEDLARVIDEEVLPPWRQFQRRLVPVANLAPEQQAFGREIVTYMQAREVAWTKFSAALRRHDRAAIEAANQELHATLDTLVLLNGKDDPAAPPDTAAGHPAAGRPAGEDRHDGPAPTPGSPAP